MPAVLSRGVQSDACGTAPAVRGYGQVMLGRQEWRVGAAASARGESSGARTSLPARGADSDISNSVAAALDRGSPEQRSGAATGDGDDLRGKMEEG
jgi:hypothetical protein